MMVRDAIQAMDVGEYAEDGDAPVDMSLNVNPLGPPDAAVEAVRNLDPALIGRYQHPDDGIRSAVADMLGVDAEAVVLTNGCDGALETLALTYFDRDATVAIPVPSFHRYEIHARKMGADIRFIEPQGDDFHPSPATMTGVDADYMILANPQNPTGERFARGSIERIIDGFDGTIILDEALAFPRRSHADLVDGDVIVAGSFSKVMGLAGLRAGYIVTEQPGPVRTAGSPFQLNAAAQEALRAAAGQDDHLERTHRTISQERSYLQQELERLGIDSSDSTSTCLLLSVDGTPFEGRGDIFLDRLDDEGVKAVAGDHFRGLSGDYIRVSVRDHETNQAFITAVENVLEQETS